MNAEEMIEDELMRKTVHATAQKIFGGKATARFDFDGSCYDCPMNRDGLNCRLMVSGIGWVEVGSRHEHCKLHIDEASSK